MSRKKSRRVLTSSNQAGGGFVLWLRKPEFWLLVLALAFRLGVLWQIRDSVYWGFYNQQSDMFANHEWAREIRSGDWLGRNTYHPYFDWMKAAAPVERWHEWWGGKQVFQQSPLYPYLLALLFTLTRDNLAVTLVFQMVMGTLQCWLVFLLGRTLFDRRTALLALAGSALFGPQVLAEAVLLRDFLSPLFLNAALVGLLVSSQSGSRWWPLLSGAMFGAALLTRENSIVFLPLALVWLFWVFSRKKGLATGALACALWMGGCLTALSPLLLRNIRVGSPPLAFSNRAGEGLIQGLAASPYEPSLGLGVRVQEEMARGPFSTVGFLRRSFTEQGAGLIGRYLAKLAVVADPYEISDNMDYAYIGRRSVLLRWALDWKWICPLGILGLVVALTRRRPGDLLCLAFVVSLIGALLVGPIYSRYRLPLVPIALIYGGYFLVWSWSRMAGAAFARRQWRAWALPPALAITVLVVFRQWLPFVPEQYYCREETYQTAANFYARRGEMSKARREIERLVECVESTGSRIDLREHRQKIQQLIDAGY